VGLDHPDDYVDPLAALGLGRGQHLVGLADAGCGPQEDLQAAPGFLAALSRASGEGRLSRLIGLRSSAYVSQR
jgi:hypothetical protein